MISKLDNKTNGQTVDIRECIRWSDDKTHTITVIAPDKSSQIQRHRTSLHTAEVVRCILLGEGYEEWDGKTGAKETATTPEGIAAIRDRFTRAQGEPEATLPTPMVISDLPPKTGPDGKREPIKITGPNWERRTTVTMSETKTQQRRREMREKKSDAMVRRHSKAGHGTARQNKRSSR